MHKKLFAAPISLMLSLMLSLTPLSLYADEGMWLPGDLAQIPFNKLKSRGLSLTPEEIYSVNNPSLKDAIVQLSIGCTGSFISPAGLILTNHHCAFFGVTAASSTENDLTVNGFLAKARNEEIQAKGYQVSVLQEYRDVTEEVLSAVKPEMSPEARDAAILKKRQEIAQAAMKDRTADGIRAQVNEMTSGVSYHLYIYLTLRDVRLVYAPPKSIGFFGGDPDNFEWPRHTGDFAFLRAYVGADGKPADFNASNVPFKPKKFLTINAGGVKEGDFTMIMGHPGATYRRREAGWLDQHYRLRLPDNIRNIRQQIEVMDEIGKRNPAQKLAMADDYFSLMNSLKAFEGGVAGISRARLIENKRAEEAAFEKWVESTPQAKQKYGDVMPRLKEIYRESNSFSEKLSVINQLLQAGTLMNVLDFAYRRAADQAKPDGQRSRQYSDEAVQRFKAQLSQTWQERDLRQEAGRVATAMARAATLPADQKIEVIEKLLEGKSGSPRAEAEAELARKAVENSKIKTLDDVNKLLSSSLSDLKASEEPGLQIVSQLVDMSAPLARRQQELIQAAARVRPQYVRGINEMKKTPYYPDANFTLRFTYGSVKTYKPRDAVSYDWQTTLAGVIEKDTGVEPFDVPAKLKELHQKKDFGSYADARLNDIPVAFLTDNDITGGNSGSPLINGKGELIGLAFDGNYEGLGVDYVFDPAMCRTLNVDIRYVLFLTEKFAGAGYLLSEMQIKRAKAAKAD